MSRRTINLNDRLRDYILSVSLREPEVLRRLRKETASYENAEMQISPEQGQLMDFLVRLIGAKRTLDVGVFTGYSALCVALALPADGRVVACDVSETWTAVARRYWREAGIEDKIDLVLAPATETLKALLEEGRIGSFDLAFIDADKKSYDDYYEYSLRLIRSGGLIMIDNVLRSGAVADSAADDEGTRVIRSLNRKIHADPRVEIALLPVGDGLTLALKK